MRHHTVGAAEFKARCLELIDRVATTGNPIVITKRGKSLVCLTPAVSKPPSLVGALKGHVRIEGDIIAPIDVSWDATDAPARHTRARLARRR